MAYDVIRAVRQLIENGIGDAARLAHILDRLESGKYLYLSDQKYLESLLGTNEYIVSKPASTESPEVVNLETNLRDINIRLEKILQNKARNERKITDNVHTTNNDSTPKSYSINKDVIVRPKTENITLVLSVLLGLISLQGMGHIYIRKIAKGLGILVMSLILSSLSVLFFLGMIKELIPSFLHVSFIPILIVGYFVLYAFQILDSRKLCTSYNAYVLEHKQPPPWW